MVSFNTDMASIYNQMNNSAFQDLKKALEDDLNGENQAIQYAGTPAEDQDPDAPLPWNDASQ